MIKLINVFHRISSFGAFISMLGMVAAVGIQVVARFLLPSAPAWTEEIARIFFIYLVAFGVGIGIKDNAFVKLELIRNYLSDKTHRKLQVFMLFTILLFSISMFYYSFLFMMVGLHEKSPAIEISMGFVFFSILILMFSAAIFSLEQLLLLSQSKNKRI